jgi:hypothetical protein
MIKKLILAIILLFAASLAGQAKEEKQLVVASETEAQINEDGENYYFSQFLFEQYGEHLWLMQRWFPAQGRMPRYELGIGPVFGSEKGIGPITNLIVKPAVGWTAEGSHYYYLLTCGTVSFKGFGHSVVLIADRKNHIVGDTRGSFEYHKARVQIWKVLWIRWEGTFKEPAPDATKRELTWASSQLGGEIQAPVGKRYKPFASYQYDFMAHKWVSHFGVRF